MTSRTLHHSLAAIAFISACMNAGNEESSGDFASPHGMHAMHAGVTPVPMPPDPAQFDGIAAVDLDPSADVVEVQLEAKPADIQLSTGHVVPMWTYNGAFPGPRIEAHVGDRIRVTLKNSLPQATTIHWHGLRVQAAMDGVEAVQAPIQPGDELSYDFVVPDAGTFWYHPHVRSNEQVERGLYGPIVVRGMDELVTTSDHVVILDDVLLDASWQIAPFDSTPMEAMLGREGNVLLANGHAHPVVDVTPGGLERFRFVNAANARYFRIALPGQQLIQIGSEAGMLEQPQKRDELLLVPGQRADIVIVTPLDAQTTSLQTLPYARGHHQDSGSTATLFDLRASGARVDTPALPATLAVIPALPSPRVERELRFGGSMMMGTGMHHGGGVRSSATSSASGMGPVFSFNGEASQRDAAKREARRRRAVVTREHHRDGPPLPSARLPLSGSLEHGRATCLARHAQCAGDANAENTSAARRSRWQMDVPLPHLRARRARNDGRA